MTTHHWFYASEVGISDGVLYATNHGCDPFVGSVDIRVDSIDVWVSDHLGRGRNLTHRFAQARTDDSWEARLTLRNGHTVHIFGDDIDIANDVIDALHDHHHNRQEEP
jgi:hypothetical protein